MTKPLRLLFCCRLTYFAIIDDHLDNDDDGYIREERANNERALEEMASRYQNIGSALTITGMILSFTPLAL